MTRPPAVEFWFDFGSNYTYLAMMRIEQEAARRGVRVAWRPFALGAIFKSFGWETSPFVLQKAKGDYVWKDMERQCRKAGLPWRKPTNFPRSALLPLRVALVAADEPWIGAFCRAIIALNFAHDREIDEEAVVRTVLSSLDVDAGPVLVAAKSPANKEALRTQTERARALGLFGAPTFLVGDEMYWGNDRLDDALEAATRGDTTGP